MLRSTAILGVSIVIVGGCGGHPRRPVATTRSSGGGATSPKGYEPAAVSFVTPLVGWSLGRSGCPDCASLRQTRDGGKHWSAPSAARFQITFYSTARSAVDDLRFANEQDGYVFGPGLFASRDGGRSWHQQFLPPVISLDASAGDAFVLTQRRPGGHVQLWRSPINEDHWTTLQLPASAQPSPTSQGAGIDLNVVGSTVVLLDQGFFGAMPSHLTGRIWLSLNAGAKWHERHVPCRPRDGGADVLSVVLTHPSSWLLDCYSNLQSSQEIATRHRLYVTGDGGRSWMRVTDPIRRNEPVALASNGGGHDFVATQGVSDVLVGSFDDGQHWRVLLQSGGSFYGWADLRFLNDRTGFVVGPTHYAAEHVYRTDDGGRTWRILRIE